MNCDTALDLVVDFLMDNLEADTQRELRNHLSECGSCADFAAQMGQAWSELGRLKESTAGGTDRQASQPLASAASARFGWRLLSKAAAVFVLLASGAFLGRLEVWNRTGAEDAAFTPAGSSYLLLIRSDEPERRAPEAQLVSEYSEWATELARRGTLISAEKLTTDPGRWVQGESAAGDTDVISGFFLIRAADYDEAERVALASPHVVYGGTIELRAIDDPGGSQ